LHLIILEFYKTVYQAGIIFYRIPTQPNR